jgi:heme/copper-type cytochrome/quinol oxidase subunit 1
MKKAWLVVRIAVETTFGLIYMTGLFLLPSIYDGSFPQFFLGYLGMPRRVHASTMAAPAVSWQNFNAMAAFIGLLLVTFLFLNGLLWFKDVFAIIRKLRTSHRES